MNEKRCYAEIYVQLLDSHEIYGLHMGQINYSDISFYHAHNNSFLYILDDAHMWRMLRLEFEKEIALKLMYSVSITLYTNIIIS